MEIWKDIEGYEGKYQVSNFGQVRSLERKVSNHTGLITVKPYKQAGNSIVVACLEEIFRQMIDVGK